MKQHTNRTVRQFIALRAAAIAALPAPVRGMEGSSPRVPTRREAHRELHRGERADWLV